MRTWPGISPPCRNLTIHSDVPQMPTRPRTLRALVIPTLSARPLTVDCDAHAFVLAAQPGVLAKPDKEGGGFEGPIRLGHHKDVDRARQVRHLRTRWGVEAAARAGVRCARCAAGWAGCGLAPEGRVACCDGSQVAGALQRSMKVDSRPPSDASSSAHPALAQRPPISRRCLHGGDAPAGLPVPLTA